jgi:hypothetical protein
VACGNCKQARQADYWLGMLYSRALGLHTAPSPGLLLLPQELLAPLLRLVQLHVE